MVAPTRVCSLSSHRQCLPSFRAGSAGCPSSPSPHRPGGRGEWGEGCGGEGCGGEGRAGSIRQQGFGASRQGCSASSSEAPIPPAPPKTLTGAAAAGSTARAGSALAGAFSSPSSACEPLSLSGGTLTAGSCAVGRSLGGVGSLAGALPQGMEGWGDGRGRMLIVPGCRHTCTHDRLSAGAGRPGRKAETNPTPAAADTPPRLTWQPRPSTPPLASQAAGQRRWLPRWRCVPQHGPPPAGAPRVGAPPRSAASAASTRRPLPPPRGPAAWSLGRQGRARRVGAVKICCSQR